MEMQSTADRLTWKLGSRHKLDDADVDAIRALPFALREVGASTYLVRDGEVPKRCSFLMQGFAFRQKLTGTGTRQIVSIQIPGDFIDLQNLFLTVSDHNVQTLSKAVIADLPIDALRELVLRSPAIGRAMWIDALVDASVFREWQLNVGRRDALARLAHLLCEFATRMGHARAADGEDYQLPMTQEQLADALGLTPVHVNRVLRTLTERGLIARHGRKIQLQDWEQLRAVADFDDRYLHLDQVG